MSKASPQLKVLSIDIGGSHIKATVLDNNGALLVPYSKVETPQPANPDNIVKAIKKLAATLTDFNKISVGFPGYVRDSIVKTAPNLDNAAWANFNLGQKLEEELGQPARVVNDADMQGLGVVNGKGLELVLTLGTGFGTAVLLDGKLLPHLEIGQSPITRHNSYDAYVGDKAFDQAGKKKWNERMEKVLQVLKTLFNYDYLYIGGGNARELTFKLDSNVKLVTNQDGIKGGARLWSTDPAPESDMPSSSKKSKSSKHS
ncbi:ROK family protein [Mucilaginibacter corticis]|uniref:ROK family protein n=1 Tax=Mucilaginibacter corticis TaxID=2597670 RepID=A0A556MUB3_9SPHI|nr:ROK family protein [Mucilaginibacter corticis]TSJ43536.1 ROK family protein [Mucilaginibacter corticis]